MSSLSSILGDVDSFINNIVQKVPQIELTSYECDHICYRCSTKEIYLQKIRELKLFGEVLVEGMIGGRPITIINLDKPIESNGFHIKCIEIPCPKEYNHSYKDGLEHAEFVIGKENDDPHNSLLLKDFMIKFPSLKFDSRALEKDINADISLEIDSNTSIKFHVRPIYEIVNFEKLNQLVIPVPANYFD